MLDGYDLFGEIARPKAENVLSRRFGYPPFTVLNARGGWWQERKRQWIAIGIKGEIGRGAGLTLAAAQVTTEGLNYYRNRKGTFNTPGPNPDLIAPRP